MVFPEVPLEIDNLVALGGNIVSKLLGISFLALALAACAQQSPEWRSIGNVSSIPQSASNNAGVQMAVLDVLNAQSDAWNRGDIPAFMEHYWKDDQLRFGSGGNVTRGWQATLERYLQTYSNREQMGQLDFSDLEVSALASDAAIVHGRWKLTRADDTPSGLFTLVFRNFGSGWVIVSDTTTSANR